jgi:hypothetical protein
LFNPERAERLVEFHARDKANPSLEEVFDAVVAATWKAPHGSGYAEQINNVVDDVVLYDLMALAANERASDEVRALAAFEVHTVNEWLKLPLSRRPNISDQAHAFFAAKQIEQFEKDPKRLDLTPPAEPPDGPPIGAMGDADDDWRP